MATSIATAIGYYSFTLPPHLQSVSLTVQHPGHVSQSRRLFSLPPTGSVENFRLKKCVPLHVAVFELQSDDSVTSASLTVLDEQAIEPPQSFTSDEKGTAQIPCAGSGTYRLELEKPGFETTASVHMLPAAHTPLRLFMRRGGGRLEGAVVSPAPSRHEVVYTVEAVALSLGLRRVTRTKSTFAFSDLPPDMYRITAALGTAAGPPVELPLATDETRTGIVIEAPPVISVTGILTDVDTRAPIEAADIRFSGLDGAPASTRTNAEGTFHLQVASRKYQLLVEKEGYLPADPDQGAALPGEITGYAPAGESSHHLEIRMRRAEVFHGLVMNPDGTPVGGAELYWIRRTGSNAQVTYRVADASGYFYFNYSAAGPNSTVFARSPSGDHLQDVSLPQRDPLRLTIPPLQHLVRLQFPDAAPISDIPVAAVPVLDTGAEEKLRLSARELLTDVNGEVVVPVASGGRYELTFEMPDGSIPAIEITGAATRDETSVAYDPVTQLLNKLP